ncbi:MAG: cation transporter [Candidatus Xenobia bacterium]
MARTSDHPHAGSGAHPVSQLTRVDTPVHGGIVIHALPGRVRLAGMKDLRDAAHAARVRSVLEHVHGVTRVEVDGNAHSCTVHFDTDVTNARSLVGLLKRHRILNQDVHWDEPELHHPDGRDKAIIGVLGFAITEVVDVLGGPVVPAAGMVLHVVGHSAPMHVLPDRIRIKVPELKAHPARLTEVEQHLLKLPGTHRFEYNRDTGSVTLHFAHNSVRPDQVLKVLRHFNCVPPAGHHHDPVKATLKEGAVELTTHLVEEVLNEL